MAPRRDSDPMEFIGNPDVRGMSIRDVSEALGDSLATAAARPATRRVRGSDVKVTMVAACAVPTVKAFDCGVSSAEWQRTYDSQCSPRWVWTRRRRSSSFRCMATTPVCPDYRTGQPEGFTRPLDESDRFVENRELYYEQEIAQSRAPRQDEPDAAPGNARPFKPL